MMFLTSVTPRFGQVRKFTIQSATGSLSLLPLLPSTRPTTNLAEKIRESWKSGVLAGARR
jgi:hypothetical protein